MPSPQHEFLTRIPVSIDAGEAQAIALALEQNTALFIDDLNGRKVALMEGLKIFGLGAVLIKAKKIGVFPTIAPVLDEIDQQGYRLSNQLKQLILHCCDEP